MTGPGIAGQIVDGRVTDAKLDELLALQVERAEMDFKRLIDPSGTRGMVELAKDVGAMSVLGGYLIGGVDGQGAPTGEMDQCRPEVFDEANLVPKLAKYLPEPITISSRVTVRDGHTLVLIYIAPHPNGYAVFHTDGQYRDSKDRIRITFRRGEAFWRAGTRSERITQSGMEQIIQRRVAEARRVWVEEQQSIRAREREELRGRDASRSKIDLSASNSGRLREKLERFVTAASPAKAAKPAAARRSPKGKAAAPAPTNRDQVQAIRDWARSAGLEVSSRGRIAKAVQEAFDAAH